MGRKGVSKRKRAKQKSAPVSGSTPSMNGRKGVIQPEQVNEKGKSSLKNNRKQ